MHEALSSASERCLASIHVNRKCRKICSKTQRKLTGRVEKGDISGGIRGGSVGDPWGIHWGSRGDPGSKKGIRAKTTPFFFGKRGDPASAVKSFYNIKFKEAKWILTTPSPDRPGEHTLAPPSF